MNAILLAVLAATLLILLLLVAVALSLAIMRRQKERQQTELAETKLSFEKEIRQVETEVSEQVMGHVASELHDNIGQMLTAMHIQLQNQTLDHPESEETLAPLQNHLSHITQQIRLLSKSLNNDFIEKSGLVGSIQTEVERLNELRRFQVEYVFQGEETPLAKEQDLMVYRIFQEIMNNALKHAKAQHVWIQLNTSRTDFRLEIKDDGVGFDYEEKKRLGDGSGLANIVKRANLANLDCHFTTKLGDGTRYIFTKKVENKSKR